jgi:hypothetical protein
MRFIHLLLAFAVAVGVSAAHFKRDPPSLDSVIGELEDNVQYLNNVLSVPVNSTTAVVNLSA